MTITGKCCACATPAACSPAQRRRGAKSLTFLNAGPQQTPGVIVMKLGGAVNPSNPYRNIVVVLNGSGQHRDRAGPAAKR
ncbi:alpha-1,6-glucosidase domain-containing protein [Deinococcus fonticola]|uniref:alpha-1,6-glucosidase domain-containing protein n=1 Tax=Deinococcus fonticola TaxID=2528713 RepID=UPI0023EA56BC|nr:alpha-1,6-glucosidase domain-containing protein [Deinococcus fonticola]